MNDNQELGQKLKTLRLSEKLTLVECSEITGLSVGFLSQIENGKTSIAIDNLQLLANCFGVEMSYFFETDAGKKDIVIKRTWNRMGDKKGDKIFFTSLTDESKDMNMLPEILTLFPGETLEKKYNVWDGDVFFYVIDGIFTLKVKDEIHEMYPSDAAHFYGNEGFSYWNDSPFVTHVFYAKKKPVEGGRT